MLIFLLRFPGIALKGKKYKPPFEYFIQVRWTSLVFDIGYKDKSKSNSQYSLFIL